MNQVEHDLTSIDLAEHPVCTRCDHTAAYRVTKTCCKSTWLWCFDCLDHAADMAAETGLTCNRCHITVQNMGLMLRLRPL